MILSLERFIRQNGRTVFALFALAVIFYFSLEQSYLFFHTVIELFSIIVAFSVFIVAWNARGMQDNNYLQFVGLSYLFIAALDLLHTLTYNGLNFISSTSFYANQFWIATRFIEAMTFLLGFVFLATSRKVNTDFVLSAYLVVSVMVTLSILVWKNFPECFIEGIGQTSFKIYSEYAIILILLISAALLVYFRKSFNPLLYRLLLLSILFTMLSEFCFTLYISNYSTSNQIGHYAKLISFFLIYKANVESGFVKPASFLFKNLKDNEEKYRTLAENLPGMILRIDKNLNCIYLNPAARILQFEEFATRFKSRTSTENESIINTSIKSAVEAAIAGSKAEESIFFTRGAEEKQWFSVLAIPEKGVSDGDETYLVICQNISKQKLAEERMLELNATKDKLFTIIAHDLKNPFTSLIFYSDIIVKNANVSNLEKMKQMAFRMNESSRHAFALLENLLSWSRLQTGILTPDPQDIDVAELLQQTKKISNPSADAKGIDLKIESDTKGTVFADRQMVATVLRNLISNAVKFSHPDSTVSVSTLINDRKILFSVCDKGVGIENVNQKHLLKIDNKISVPGTAAEKGTGLGLVLCKEFVEINGGEIWFESEFGEGTTFYFTLPLVDRRKEAR